MSKHYGFKVIFGIALKSHSFDGPRIRRAL